jgi:energy-coupling factor transporter ATP-binding protein EcfA2
MIPQTIEVTLKCDVFKNFRCQMAADSLDIDSEKKSIHHLKIENINIPKEWNIAVIYGSSGSGKTTLAKKLFGEDVFKSPLIENEPIINQFPDNYKYEDCANLLNGIGLTSVPCWIRPVYTLSNGQKARAEAALLMTLENKIICIDEWTSVVDRTVAKAMSFCVQKFARKLNKKIILLSCHKDIIEWVNPDWLIECNKQEFNLPKGEDFFFEKRDVLRFDIREVDTKTWRYFSKYHYLSERLPGGKIHCYGLFLNEDQIGFQCFANYTPIKKGTIPIFHSNRTVIHPDYAGLGLGIKFINETSRICQQKYGYKIMAKFSSTPVFKAMIKQKCWKFLGEKRLFGKMKVTNILRQSTNRKNTRSAFRECGVKTYHFEYQSINQ